MTELRAESLSPIDAATLWPQLRRLDTEVIATRAGENLLVSSGLAATGLTHLPRMPRTAVLGVRRGLRYRGVLVVRELSGGAAWEAASLRIAREKDDEAVRSLLGAAGMEVARRGGRSVFLRYAEGSPHAPAVRQGGFMAYSFEHLHALPAQPQRSRETAFRPAARSDRAGLFRLYCSTVPQNVRREEATILQEWRAVLDSYDCQRHFVLEQQGALTAWVGIGEREAHLLAEPAIEGAVDAALDLTEAYLDARGVVVINAFQGDIERNALVRGYTALGTRLLCVRRLAALNPIPAKEVVAVPADMPLAPQ
ncbi:MAG: hypothetical protein ACR2HN_12115 [Tepidiformaceae bacterium]